MVRWLVSVSVVLLVGCDPGPPDCVAIGALEATAGPGTEPVFTWEMGDATALTVEEADTGQSVWLVQGERTDDNPNDIESPITYGDTSPDWSTRQEAQPLEEGVDYTFTASIYCLTSLGPAATRAASVDFTP